MNTNQVIGHRVYQPGTKSTRGNVSGTLAPAVDVAVYGWYITATLEPAQGGPNRLVADAQVFAPESFKPSEKDHIVLPGVGEFEVLGIVQDFNHGPFSWAPGNVIDLKKEAG